LLRWSHGHVPQWSPHLLYHVCKQVEQFSHNISKCMNKHMHYCHIPLVD
jgi:hypothetical protein